MSGDLPIRKARTKREKNKSYNDSRNKFRASLKPERTDNSPSEEDDKIKEKKMKLDGQGEGIAQSIQNTSEDKEKQLKVVEEVDQKMADKLIETKRNSPGTKEQKDSKDEQYSNIETGEIKNSDESDTAVTRKKVTENHNEAQGSSNSYIIEERKSTANKKKSDKDQGSKEIFTWEYMLDSDEEETASQAKQTQKYVKVVISTPPAKTTSEEENTDDEEKDEDSDGNEKISKKINEYDKDKDNDGSGGGTSTFKSGKEGDGSGGIGEGGKYGDNMMSAGDNTGGAGGDANDCVDGDRDNETEDDEEPSDDKEIEKDDEQSADEQMEGGDYSTDELNLEGAVDPYDFTDEDEDEDSSNFHDRYDFFYLDGGSDHDSDFSYGGDFHDEVNYGEDHRFFNPEGRGTG